MLLEEAGDTSSSQGNTPKHNELFIDAFTIPI